VKKRTALATAALVCLTAGSIPGQAFGLQQTTTAHHGRHLRHRVRLRWNPLFRPSHDSLIRQNEEIDRLELPRIQNDAELEDLKARMELVPIVESQTLRIERRLDPERRYCRPWTRDFLDDLSAAYYQRFGEQIQVNSAVRTVQVQKKLRRHNRNAAPETGATASSHLAGLTVDLQRRGMTRDQIRWMEQYLLPLKNIGLIEPEEERRQWVFHIMVSDRYADWHDAKVLAGEAPVVNASDMTLQTMVHEEPVSTEPPIALEQTIIPQTVAAEPLLPRN
jgi:hypothetical protein